MTAVGLTHRTKVNTPLTSGNRKAMEWLRRFQNTIAARKIFISTPVIHVLQPPLFPPSPYSPTVTGSPTLSYRPHAPVPHTSSFFNLLHTELGSGGCCRVMLRGCIAKHELAAPQDRAHTILRCLPRLGGRRTQVSRNYRHGRYSHPQKQTPKAASSARSTEFIPWAWYEHKSSVSHDRPAG